MPRVAAVGDIHGEISKLESVLAQLLPELDRDDTILFIGDYIDRGPDSKGVVDRVLSLREDRNVISLRGNHEQLMLDAAAYFEPSANFREMDADRALAWFYNGAHQTLASYPEAENWRLRIPEKHWEFFRSTLIEHAQGHYHFVHAGLVPTGITWLDKALNPKLWIREEFINSLEDFGRTVVFGHTPLRNGKPLFMPNKIGIDTAAAYGGPLTAIIVDPAKPFRDDEIVVIQSDGAEAASG